MLAFLDVGVIAPSYGCPGSYVWIHMDNEDSRQASSVTGWVGATKLNDSGNLVLTFCRVHGDQFRQLSSTSSPTTNYAVLKLGDNCPLGSVEFGRLFDNEDRNNQNSSSGNDQIWPNYQDGNTTLRFCLFRGSGNTVHPSLPALGFEYGVFAHPAFTRATATGQIFSDDEDSGNANAYYVDAAWQWDAKAIVTDGENTTLYVARTGDPICGDNICIGGETETGCPADCTRCGNGVCGPRENATTCIEDCGRCGDGYCSSRENDRTCPADCMICGDGICSPKETRTCPSDCGLSCNPLSSGEDGLIPTCPRQVE